MQQDQPPTSTQSPTPEPLMTPNWFSNTTPVPPSERKGFFHAHKKARIALLWSLVLVVVAGSVIVGIVLLKNEDRKTRQAIFSSVETSYQSLQRDVTGIYSTDIDDIDPAQIQQEWENYQESIGNLKDSEIYKDREIGPMVDALESHSLQYKKFIEALPTLYSYFSTCSPKDMNISICKNYMQNILDLDDPLTKDPAGAILAALNQPFVSAEELANQLAGPEDRLVSAADGIDSLDTDIQLLGTKIQSL